MARTAPKNRTVPRSNTVRSIPARGRASTGVTVDIEDITPAQAKALLEKVPEGQRKLREHVVRKLAEAMLENDFKLSPDAIAIDTNGFVWNGQHRLAAVVRSGKTQPFMVMRGVDAELFTIMDQGLKRSFADVLRARGVEKSQSNVAAAVRRSWMLDHGLLPSNTAASPSVAQMLEWMDENPGITEAVSASYGVSQVVRGLPVTAIAAARYLTSRDCDPVEVNKFWEEVHRGADADSPAQMLRERGIRWGGAKEKPNNNEIMAIIFKAWNSWVRGDYGGQLRWRATGPRKEPFPHWAKTWEALRADGELTDDIDEGFFSDGE